MNTEQEQIFEQIQQDYDSSVVPLFKAQPPLMPFVGGYGYFGTLLLNSLTGRIQCHYCGKWWRSVASHSWKAHQVFSTNYKKEVGLNLGTPLVSPAIIERNVLNGKEMYEKNNLSLLVKNYQFKKGQNSYGGVKSAHRTLQTRNVSGTCPAQLKYRFDLLVKQCGRVPKKIEAEGVVSWKHYFSSYNAALIAWGYKPNRIVHRRGRNGKKYEKKELLGSLVNFYKTNKREPMSIDARGCLIPSLNTFSKYFGSFIRAKELAGVRK